MSHNQMTRSSIQTHKKTKAIFVALFLVGIFWAANSFFAYGAHAATTLPTGNSGATLPTGNSGATLPTGGSGTTGLPTGNSGATLPTGGSGINNTAGIGAAGKNIDITCSGGFFECIFKVMLVGVLGFIAMIIAAVTALFGWVVDPNNISGAKGILNQPAIVQIWTNVRDFLNMFFILVLLFSAFCTIFQYDKWGLKAVWLRVVINALLVNFSYTIARFVIDVSNVMMYYMLNNIFPSANGAGSGIFGTIANNSGLNAILHPPDANLAWSYLFASIVFAFILAITLLVLAVMFVIRLCVLAIIVMFAPVGFVGYIFPSIHKYADQWWDNLFRYSFFAPIMVFMLAIAISIMNAMAGAGGSNMQAFLKTANGQTTSSGEASVIANMAFFAIPIIILWIGMGVSQKMGIAGAGMVVGAGKGVAKWAGKKFSGYNAVKRQWDGFAQQRKARQDAKNKTNMGNRFGKWANKKQDTIHGNIPILPGSKKAKERAENMNKAANREDIDNNSKGKEGHGTINLVNNINSHVASPPTNKKDLIEAAGDIKQSMSRGKEFEMEVEAQIKAGVIKILSTGAVATNAAERDQAKREYYAASRDIIQKAEKA